MRAGSVGASLMNDFKSDDVWQKSVRDAVLAPGFYKQYSEEGRYVFIDKGSLAMDLQRKFAVDTIYQSDDGVAVCVEEKIVRWPGYHYNSYTLETDSCTNPGYESQGWMHYGKADYLLYCFVTNVGAEKCKCNEWCGKCKIRAHLIKFDELQKWFWPIVEDFSVFQMKTKNKTKGRIVPIEKVKNAIPVYRYIVNG